MVKFIRFWKGWGSYSRFRGDVATMRSRAYSLGVFSKETSTLGKGRGIRGTGYLMLSGAGTRRVRQMSGSQTKPF